MIQNSIFCSSLSNINLHLPNLPLFKQCIESILLEKHAKVYTTLYSFIFFHMFPLTFPLVQHEVDILSTGWISRKYCTDIPGAQKLNPNDFSDSLTFLVGPPWVQVWSQMYRVLNNINFILFVGLYFHTFYLKQDYVANVTTVE